MTSPISLCFICKNDENTVEAMLQSFRPFVQEIVAIDTGSTDTTPEIVKKYADIFEVYTDCNDPQTGLIQDFSMARQRSIDLSTQPYFIWADSDDIVTGVENLHLIIKDVEKNKGDIDGLGIMFPYEYSYDQNGNCTCRHYRERLFLNKNLFEVKNPVHEVICPKDNAKIAMVPREELIFKHRRQYSAKVPEIGRNLRILRKYFEKVGETDARQMYYLGLECCNAGLVDEAIQHLSRYIELSGWHDERAMACLKLVEIYQSRGDYQNGLKWAFKTVEIFENWSEGYFALGKMFYFFGLQGGPDERRNWEKCIYFIKEGLKFPPTKTLLFINPLERELEIYEYLNMALNKIGDVKGALQACNTALEKHPDRINLVNNKKLYEVFLARHEAVVATTKLKEMDEVSQHSLEMISALLNKQNIQMPVKIIGWNIPDICDLKSLPLRISTEQLQSTVIMMWKQYMLYDEVDSAIMFLENAPVEVRDSSLIKDALVLTKNYKNNVPNDLSINNHLDIIFFAGDGLENWNGHTKAIGGSETMMIQLSKRLSARGHHVRVYNSCDVEGVYSGVEYYRTERFQNLECDVLVVSRQTQYLDQTFNVNAKLKLLWVHDTVPLNHTNRLLLRADRILALSNWHKQNIINVCHVHSDQIVVTRNGIDITQFNKKIVRDRYKVICSSSPDRYLPILLELWPRIKKMVPQATLNIAYGFNNWEKIAPSMQGHPELIASLKQKIKDMEPLGVKYLGRLGEDELIDEMLSSGVNLYCTWFSETFFITGAQNQAAGVRIVTSPIAAITETVGERAFALIPGDWTSDDYGNKFVESAIQALTIEDDQDRIALQKYAKENFCIDKLTEEWEKMFYNLIEEVKTNPIVPYQPTVPYRMNGRGYYDGDTRLEESHPERRKQNG